MLHHPICSIDRCILPLLYFSSRRRHTRSLRDWSSDVCSSDLVHQDGLVHVSQIADRYVADPNQAVKVGQRVRVTVMSVDLARNRIALSMKSRDRKSTRLNSSHVEISYAVFCLKKKIIDVERCS